MDKSRTIECHGPCDEYGDSKPDGVARVGFWYHARGCDHHIVMDYGEALMLAGELENSLLRIRVNRLQALGHGSKGARE